MTTKVELNEDYVHGLRRERMKHRRSLTGSNTSCADILNRSISSSTSPSPSPVKSDGPPSNEGYRRMKDARSASLRGYDHSTSPTKSPGAMPMPMARERERERHRRTDSTDSTRFQVKLSLMSWQCYIA